MGLSDGAPQIVRRNFRQYDRDNGQVGMYAPSSPCFLPGALTLVANQGRASRFVPSRNMTVTKIAFAVTTAAGSDDPVDVGIYSAAGAKLVSTGATTGQLNTIGPKSLTVTATTLVARTAYYVALSCGAIGTTAAIVIGASAAGIQAAQLFGTTIGLVEVDAASSVHPLPSTWTVGAISGVGIFAAVKES